MGKVSRIIDYLSDNNYYSNYLPIFRVYICFRIIKKTYLDWSSISLIFGRVIEVESPILEMFSFLDCTLLNIPIILILIISLSLLFAFGLGKRLTILLLIICIYFKGELNYLQNNDKSNLLLCSYLFFTNSYDYFSLNRLKYKNVNIKKLSNFISNLAVYSIMIHLCLVYFTSFIHKIHSDMWFNGVANYYIFNLERYNSPFNYFFSKNLFFTVFSTYFTLVFELLFPILIWNKKFRNTLLILGLCLHICRYYFLMIYDFEILFIMIYGFFLTNQEWNKILFRKNLFY